MLNRLLQGFQAKAGVHCIRQAPAQCLYTNPLPRPDREKAFDHWNITDISLVLTWQAGHFSDSAQLSAFALFIVFYSGFDITIGQFYHLSYCPDFGGHF